MTREGDSKIIVDWLIDLGRWVWRSGKINPRAELSDRLAYLDLSDEARAAGWARSKRHRS